MTAQDPWDSASWTKSFQSRWAVPTVTRELCAPVAKRRWPISSTRWSNCRLTNLIAERDQKFRKIGVVGGLVPVGATHARIPRPVRSHAILTSRKNSSLPVAIRLLFGVARDHHTQPAQAFVMPASESGYQASLKPPTALT